MHLAIPALFSLFAAMAQASIQIPANQTDGVYIVKDIDGIETHIRIGDVNTTASGTRIAKTASIRQKRDFDFPPHSHIECDTTNVFYHDDFYSKGAYDGFVTACKASKGRKLEGGKAIYVRYSSSSAYFCSYRKNPCVVDEWEEAVARIQGQCTYTTNNWQISGYIGIPEWDKTYGYSNDHASVC